MKTVFDKKIADCQVLLNFLNKFNAHKILCGGYYYSFHCKMRNLKARDKK